MQTSRYWFPAKRHGWGWGLPSVWQGWAVLAVYFALLASGAFVFLPAQEVPTFVAWALVLSLVLTVVCAVKGEPPGWRSGE